MPWSSGYHWEVSNAWLLEPSQWGNVVPLSPGDASLHGSRGGCAGWGVELELQGNNLATAGTGRLSSPGGSAIDHRVPRTTLKALPHSP